MQSQARLPGHLPHGAKNVLFAPPRKQAPPPTAQPQVMDHAKLPWLIPCMMVTQVCLFIFWGDGGPWWCCKKSHVCKAGVSDFSGGRCTGCSEPRTRAAPAALCATVGGAGCAHGRVGQALSSCPQPGAAARHGLHDRRRRLLCVLAISCRLVVESEYGGQAGLGRQKCWALARNLCASECSVFPESLVTV